MSEVKCARSQPFLFSLLSSNFSQLETRQNKCFANVTTTWWWEKESRKEYIKNNNTGSRQVKTEKRIRISDLKFPSNEWNLDLLFFLRARRHISTSESGIQWSSSGRIPSIHTHAYNDDDDSGVCINLMYHAIKINYAYICFSFFLLLSDK